MSGLALRVPGSSAVTRSSGTPCQSSASKSTDEVTWSGSIVRFADLPAKAQTLAPTAGALVSSVIPVRGLRKAGSGRQELRVGFRSYSDHIVVVDVVRALTQAADGRLRPRGYWRVAEHETLHAAGPVTATGRRRVAMGPLGAAPAAASGGADTWAARRGESGPATEVFLPASVRDRLAFLVPSPEVHLGRIHCVPGQKQKVELLRIGGNLAVVINASRPDDARAVWEVQQWEMRLETALELGTGTAARRAVAR